MISGRVNRSRSRKISALISYFSVAASTTKSHSASLPRSVTDLNPCRAPTSFSAAVILFFATSRSRFFAMVPSARSRNRLLHVAQNHVESAAREHSARSRCPSFPRLRLPLSECSCVRLTQNARVYHREPVSSVFSVVSFAVSHSNQPRNTHLRNKLRPVEFPANHMRLLAYRAALPARHHAAPGSHPILG